MKNLSFPGSLYVALGLVVMVSGSAGARQWNTTPVNLAIDYAQIIDQRAEGEFVMLTWLPPEMLEDEAEFRTARAVLSEYFVITAVRTKVSPSGQYTFPNTEAVVLLSENNRKLVATPETELPPSASEVINTLGSMMALGLGPMGEGMKLFVFKDTGINSCGDGEFWVLFADEKYDCQTPIPGC